MIRKIIEINEEKCNGCEACAKACHEGAIGMVNGKAKLIRDDYCDGLGDCLPACPTDAISFVEREATEYNEEAVKLNQLKKSIISGVDTHFGCPGTSSKYMGQAKKRPNEDISKATSQLGQWPVQIKLVPVNALYFNGADLLIAADCTAFAYGNFHSDFIKDKITIIGCPKLDSVDYSEKLAEIIKSNDISSITVTRMEVPCCGGIENAVINAIKSSGKDINCKIAVIKINGELDVIRYLRD